MTYLNQGGQDGTSVEKPEEKLNDKQHLTVRGWGNKVPGRESNLYPGRKGSDITGN